MPLEALERYNAWLQNPLIDERTKEELRRLAGNAAEIEDRFFKWLQFGTGGLRGTIGAGTNRMNIYTIRLVTQALATILKAEERAGGGVVIAHDSRRMSREFTQAAGEVLVGNGIPVYVFPEVAPTPLLSFAVRQLQASAGIVITASHNPPEYNGYKVYNEQGSQILGPEAERISAEMTSLGLEDVLFEESAQEHPLWTWLGDALIEEYYQALLDIIPGLEGAGELGILYTPLHGAGGRFVLDVLRRAGFTKVRAVEKQLTPDGEFPTLSSPNPEDPEAFQLAFQEAEVQPCDLILATDPDADRLGAAVRQGENWVLLNGNQLGVLMADFLLSRLPAERLARGVIVKTIVTTDLIQPLARKFGVEVRSTLTGFKYIGALIDELPAEGKEFLFGLEESYGYLAGTHVRDKDGVLASLLVAAAAAYHRSRGATLVDRLEELFAELGYYAQDLVSYHFATSLEAERSRSFLARLAQSPPESLGSERVVEMLNYRTGIHLDLRTGSHREIALPREGVLQWLTEKDSKVTIRQSGTEPKMKLYLEVKGAAAQEAQARLAELKASFDQLVQEGLR